MKRCQNTTISETVDRSDLWLAQTPQAFDRELGQAAFRKAIASLHDKPELADVFTDDVSVLDWYGITGYVVDGSSTNIKITTSADWEVAEALLSHENEQRDY